MVGDASRPYDIFISYAAADDERPAPHDRWISRFVEDLSKLLTTLLGGERPRIYFDQQTFHANHDLERLTHAARRSKIFLSASSPAYHRRSWTARELEAYAAAHADLSGLFLVELDRVREADRLPQMAHRHVRSFHEAVHGDVAQPSIPLSVGTDLFYRELARLAREIADELERRVEGPAARPAAGARLGPILLAQVTEDLEDDRDAVRAYLEQFGVDILPSDDFPQGGPEFRAAVAQDMAAAKLLVQLLGKRPGRTPRDLPEGYARAQAAAARAAKVPTLQWCRPDLMLAEVTDAEHRAFLSGPDVMVSTLERFKAEVVSRLRTPTVLQRTRSDRLVFINADTSDRRAAQALSTTIPSNYAVVLPMAEAAASIRDDVTDNIRDCDVLLLLYGQVGPNWVRDQLRHVRKARAGQEPLAGVICLGPPPEKTEIAFSMPGFVALDCVSAESTWNLDPVRRLFELDGQ